VQVSINHSRLCRLLVVDDDQDCCVLILRNALRCGFEAFAVWDAQQLETTIAQWEPDVITLDLWMPGLDRLEIIWKLHRTRFSGQVLIVSGQTDEVRMEAAVLARTNGIDVLGHMPKPLELVKLRDLLTGLRWRLLSRGLLGLRSNKSPDMGTIKTPFDLVR
jgi:DNA-binding response OmpR family regulator